MSNLGFGPFAGGNTAVFQDVQASGVAGVLLLGGSDNIVPFNTEVEPQNFVSLSGNQFTLAKGIYHIVFVDAWTQSGADRQVWIKDTSNVSYGGAKARFNSSTGLQAQSQMEFFIEIPAGGKTVELMNRASGNVSHNNTLSPTNGNEYYQQIIFKKVG